MTAPQSDEVISALLRVRRSSKGLAPGTTLTESPWNPKTTYSVRLRS